MESLGEYVRSEIVSSNGRSYGSEDGNLEGYPLVEKSLGADGGSEI